MKITIMNTMLIQLTNKKAARFIHEMEDLELIKVLKEEKSIKTRISQKFRGILTKEKGRDLQEHIKKMRSDWQSI